MMKKTLIRIGSLLPDRVKIQVRKTRFYNLIRNWIFRSKVDLENYEIMGGLLKASKIFTDADRSGYILGFYELDITKILKKYCKPGMVVCDIGAHHGYFSMIMAKLVGETGHCYAFEANSHNYKKITRSILVNQLNNLSVEHLAVCSRSGQVVFNLYPGHDLMGKLGEYVKESQERLFRVTETVQSTSLDTYFTGAKDVIIGLMKIDVEGAEDVVIEGATGIITRDKPYIVMEVHDCFDKVLTDIPCITNLIQLGYSIQELAIDQTGGRNKHVFAEPILD